MKTALKVLGSIVCYLIPRLELVEALFFDESGISGRSALFY